MSQTPTNKQTAAAGCLVLILLFATAYILGAKACAPSPETRARLDAQRAIEDAYGSPVAAYTMAQHFVEQRLKTPGSAKWPLGYSKFVTNLGPGRYAVSGYCDAQNTFGALVRINFSCTMVYEGSDTWRCEDLSISER